VRSKILFLVLFSVFLVRASVQAQIDTIVVNRSLISTAGLFYLPVGARGLNVGSSLGIGTVTGQQRLEFPGSYTNCLSRQTYSGWYVAIGYNKDKDYRGDLYEDFNKDANPDFHPGEDWNGQGGLNTDECQPVFPMATGVVIGRGVSGGWGNIVLLVHKVLTPSVGEEYFVSVYAHLQEISSTTCLGCQVSQTDMIGKVGKTGNGYAHLHWEVRRQTFLEITGTTIALRNSSPFIPSTWPAKVSPADNGQSFITQNYCEPSTFVRTHGLCQAAEALAVTGGTFVDRTLGLIGTSFLSDPIGVGGTIPFYDVSGPSGWNSNNPFRCNRYQPPATASNRAICWQFVLPVSGQYTAVASDGMQSSFTLNAASQLAAPQITNLNLTPGQVTVSWTAEQTAPSFLVRINPIPFTGITGEMVVPGNTRTLTLPNLTLLGGQPYQAVIFAFSQDVRTPGPLVGPFNIGAHAVAFNAPGVAALQVQQELRSQQQLVLPPPSPPSSQNWP
jgi:murein DD-endopeptidase MepM/ murein hydrolase activator NlpD